MTRKAGDRTPSSGVAAGARKARLWILMLVASGVCWTASSVGSTAAFAQASSGVSISVAVLGDLTLIRERHLHFGTLIANSGEHTVTRDSDSAGFMRIVGDWNKQVLISLSHRPTELIHTQIPTAVVPLNLDVHYTPRGQGGPGAIDACHDYQVMTGVSAVTRLRCLPTDTAIGNNRAMSLLFFSGTVTVGNVPPGTYSATITVTVEYD